MLRLEAYTLSNRGRSLRTTDSQSAGWKLVPKPIFLLIVVLASSLSRGDEGETNQGPDPMPAIVEAEVDVVIKSTEGKMNSVLNLNSATL